jgi:hypothetical protein
MVPARSDSAAPSRKNQSVCAFTRPRVA